MNPAGDRPASTASHLVRPGVTLTWADAPADPAAAVFCFSLGDPPEMRCGRTLPPAGRGGFEVAIRFDTDALRALLAGDESDAAGMIRRALAVPPAPDASPHLVLPLTATARFALESIRRCPFAGAVREMALTARAHDLMIEFLTAAAELAAVRGPPLTRSVSDQIHAAAACLQRRLETPPTVAALAREVGLGESTLKRGFHQVFGATVFGYLRAQRMERARVLLESGEATVLEAATLVGYSNPSNFAAAFRRQFGLNPKAFQLAARRH